MGNGKAWTFERATVSGWLWFHILEVIPSNGVDCGGGAACDGSDCDGGGGHAMTVTLLARMVVKLHALSHMHHDPGVQVAGAMILCRRMR